MSAQLSRPLISMPFRQVAATFPAPSTPSTPATTPSTSNGLACTQTVAVSMSTPLASILNRSSTTLCRPSTPSEDLVDVPLDQECMSDTESEDWDHINGSDEDSAQHAGTQKLWKSPSKDGLFEATRSRVRTGLRRMLGNKRRRYSGGAGKQWNIDYGVPAMEEWEVADSTDDDEASRGEDLSSCPVSYPPLPVSTGGQRELQVGPDSKDSPVHVPKPVRKPPLPTKPVYRAHSMFQVDNGLSLASGDVVLVLSQLATGYWYCSNAAGKTGWVPSCFLEKVGD